MNYLPADPGFRPSCILSRMSSWSLGNSLPCRTCWFRSWPYAPEVTPP